MAKTNGKIHILFVLDNLTIGGAQKLALDIAQNLDATRVQPFACTLFSSEKIENEPFAVELRKMNIPLARLQLKSWRDFRTFAQFRKLVKDWHIDVVHGHMIPADFWACLTAKLAMRAKTVYTRHNSYPINGQSSKAQLWLLNNFAADNIVAISNTIKNYIEEETFAPAKKVRLIYNGVDSVRFNPEISGEDVRKEWGIGSDEIVVGNISRYEPRKGYDVFVRVAAGLASKFPDVRFIACGHGPQKDELLNMAEELGLGKKLIFTEPRPDVEKFIAAMDVFLFPTYWGEGLPLSVCEAMACGKPVVASNIGSNKELVTDGENGFLPAPKDWKMATDGLPAEPFIQKIAQLIENPELQKTMGIDGRARVEKLFNVKTMVKEHEKFYSELTEKK